MTLPKVIQDILNTAKYRASKNLEFAGNVLKSNFTDPNLGQRLVDTTSQVSEGLGKRAADAPVRVLNTFARLGGSVPNIGVNRPAPQLPKNMISNVLYPTGGVLNPQNKVLRKDTYADPNSQAAGAGLYDTAEMMAAGTALRSVPAVHNVLQKPIFNIAEKLYEKNKLLRPLAYGVANAGEGLTYSMVRQAQKAMDEKPFDPWDIPIDVGIGSILAGTPIGKLFGYSGTLGTLGSPAAKAAIAPVAKKWGADSLKEANILDAGQGPWAGKGALKQQFDNALYGGDTATVKRLLPDVPDEYKAVDTISARLSKLLGDEVPAVATPTSIAKNQGGFINFGADVGGQGGQDLKKAYMDNYVLQTEKQSLTEQLATATDSERMDIMRQLDHIEYALKQTPIPQDLAGSVIENQGVIPEVMSTKKTSSFINPQGNTIPVEATHLGTAMKLDKGVALPEDTLSGFLNKGNIRTVVNATEANFELTGEPTQEQISAMIQLAHNKKVYMDVTAPGGSVIPLEFKTGSDMSEYFNKRNGDPFKISFGAQSAKPKSEFQRILEDEGGSINFGAKVSIGRDIDAENAAKRAKALGGFEPVPLETPINAQKAGVDALQDTSSLGVKQGEEDYITNQEQGLFNPGEGYHATPTKKTAEAIFEKGQEAQRVALKTEFDAEDAIHMQDVRRELNDNLAGISDSIRKNTSMAATKDISQLQDLTPMEMGSQDYIRNFQKVFGKSGEAWDNVNETVLKPFRAAKGQYAQDVITDSNDIYQKFVKEWGINAGSKESALLQDFGEGNISLEQLKSAKPADWENYVEADKYARGFYDKWLKQVNNTLSSIYPEQPDKLIPYRQDYYRHFREFESGYSGLKNIMESQAGIPSELAGISDIVKPQTKFMAFAQKRLGIGVYKKDAVGGMLDYLQAASYAKNVDPEIPKFRTLAKELADRTAEGTPDARQLNGFIEYLNDFSNDLAGKTNPMDRAVAKWLPGGRKTLRVVNWVNNRIKRNVIVGNASSAISQFFNFPNGLSDAGAVNTAKGLGQYTKQVLNGVDEADPITESNFMKERYMSQARDQFDTGMLQNLNKFGKWMQRVGDKAVAQTIWNAEYIKAAKAGVDDAVDTADQQTAKMIAGRGVGEVPMVQKAISTQLVAPFQVEVNNAWLVMKDQVNEKQFGKLMTLLIANHIMNKGAELIKGNAVVFDPIQAITDAIRTKQPLRVAGEFMGNAPFGQTVASLTPEYGFTIPGTSIKVPSRKELYGRQDPTRYGSGLLLEKGIQDPIFKLLAPFGGAQIKKTMEGIKSYSAGQVTDSKGKKMFDVEQNLPNFLRSILYGSYSTPESVKYYEGKDVPAGSTPKKATSSFGKGSSYGK